ncbi:hypothetical protein C8Q72DRAFT_794773 [Fomitopsis betulina]|nr:hypothetical protein C8Q72DRAFT_794773 [Fomitopsis betulina]
MRMLAIVTQAAMCCLLSDICNVDTAGVVITGRKQDAAVVLRSGKWRGASRRLGGAGRSGGGRAGFTMAETDGDPHAKTKGMVERMRGGTQRRKMKGKETYVAAVRDNVETVPSWAT